MVGEAIRSLAFLPDGENFVLATGRSVWSLIGGDLKRIRSYPEQTGTHNIIRFVEVSRDDDTIAVGLHTYDTRASPAHWSELELFRSATGERLYQMRSDEFVVGYRFAERDCPPGVFEITPDEPERLRYRALESHLGEGHFWKRGREALFMIRPFRNGFVATNFTEVYKFEGLDDLREALALNRPPPKTHPILKGIRSLIGIRARPLAPLIVPASVVFRRPEGATCEAVTPNGMGLLFGNRFGRVVLWGFEERRVVNCWDWPIGAIHELAVSPDGLMAAAIGGKGQLLLWDME